MDQREITQLFQRQAAMQPDGSIILTNYVATAAIKPSPVFGTKTVWTISAAPLPSSGPVKPIPMDTFPANGNFTESQAIYWMAHLSAEKALRGEIPSPAICNNF